MYIWIKNYIQQEIIHAQEGEIAFLKPKIFIIVFAGVLSIWSYFLQGKESLVFWIFFIIIIIFSVIILFLTYKAKKL